MRAAKALARLCGGAGLPEPSLFTYVITIPKFNVLALLLICELQILMNEKNPGHGSQLVTLSSNQFFVFHSSVIWASM